MYIYFDIRELTFEAQTRRIEIQWQKPVRRMESFNSDSFILCLLEGATGLFSRLSLANLAYSSIKRGRESLGLLT